MFIPGLCATTCPLAGLFCGGSGYLCTIAAGTNEEPIEGTTLVEGLVGLEELPEEPRSHPEQGIPIEAVHVAVGYWSTFIETVCTIFCKFNLNV